MWRAPSPHVTGQHLQAADSAPCQGSPHGTGWPEYTNSSRAHQACWRPQHTEPSGSLPCWRTEQQPQSQWTPANPALVAPASWTPSADQLSWPQVTPVAPGFWQAPANLDSLPAPEPSWLLCNSAWNPAQHQARSHRPRPWYISMPGQPLKPHVIGQLLQAADSVPCQDSPMSQPGSPETRLLPAPVPE